MTPEIEAEVDAFRDRHERYIRNEFLAAPLLVMFFGNVLTAMPFLDMVRVAFAIVALVLIPAGLAIAVLTHQRLILRAERRALAEYAAHMRDAFNAEPGPRR